MAPIHRILCAVSMAALLVLAVEAGAPWAGYRDSADARAAASQLASMTPADRAKLWRDWMKEHKKDYDPQGAKGKARFAAFSANLDAMIQHNSQPDATYFQGLNEFSDQTFHEFAATTLMQDKTFADLDAHSADAPAWTPPLRRRGRKLQQTTPPKEWDWRTRVAVPPTRNQGSCGSCWAFAAVGCIEIQSLVNGVSTSPDVSEQQMVDCVSSINGYYSGGCGGGYSDEVFTYTQKLYATTEASYPWTGAATGSCRVTSTTPAPAGSLGITTSPAYTRLPQDPNTIMTAVSTTGPVVAYFNVQNSFYQYISGIYQATDCANNTVNHAMVIVGYNATAGMDSADSYWIIRNSWGTWGDQGYIKVKMMSGTLGACGMYYVVYQSKPTKAAGSPLPLPSPSPSPTPLPSPSPSPSPQPLPSPSPSPSPKPSPRPSPSPTPCRKKKGRC